MTVAELMNLLAGLDPSLRVVIDGYEGGFDDVMLLDLVKIRSDANLDPDQDYYGRHLVDKESSTETALWIKGRQARGDKVTVQSLAQVHDKWGG